MSREIMQQALDDICGAKLCEINSMSSRLEMIRLMDKAITALRQALARDKGEQALDKKADNARELGLDYEPDHGFDRTASHMAGEYVDTAQSEPIVIMGHYVGEGKVVSASFGLPEGSFDMSTNQQNVNTSEERVHKSEECVHEMQRLGQELEQEPVAWNDNTGEMPLNMYCKALVNWQSYSTDGDRMERGENVEVIVVKYQRNKNEESFVFLHAGNNQYLYTGVTVLKWKPLYTAPPKREWQGLTDEEILSFVAFEPHPLMNRTSIIHAVQAKLREKNGY